MTKKQIVRLKNLWVIFFINARHAYRIISISSKEIIKVIFLFISSFIVTIAGSLFFVFIIPITAILEFVGVQPKERKKIIILGKKESTKYKEIERESTLRHLN